MTGMESATPVAGMPSAREFTVHLLNNYAYVGLTSMADALELDVEAVRDIIRAEHDGVVSELASFGVQYAQLGGALVPKSGRHEVAFVFDSTRSTSGSYGDEFARRWIPIVKSHGPIRTAISSGDLLGVPSELVWREFETRLIRTRAFPKLSRELYYVVYLTNVSTSQLATMHEALTHASDGYLGYVDCSVWNPLKRAMLLPQLCLRTDDVVITSKDDMGHANPQGYPYDLAGFRVVGVSDERFSLLLTHRLDNGVPAWAQEDSALALTLLGGARAPLHSSPVSIDERRIAYLRDGHGASLRKAGLENHDADELAAAIADKFANGLIYNLRFKSGSRDGVPAAELDAFMYSVQVEFPDEAGLVKRYQVGLKYDARKHASEVVTFF